MSTIRLVLIYMWGVFCGSILASWHPSFGWECVAYLVGGVGFSLLSHKPVPDHADH